MIKKYLAKIALLFIVMSVLVSCQQKRSGKPRVLVFSKTAGFHHNSITQGNEALQKLGLENNFDVDTTTNSEWFTEDSLKNYSAVVFLNTTGDLLNNYQEADFERYIQAGGGFLGIHGAADAEYDWGWYGRLVGGYFATHPEVKEGELTILDKNHLATKELPETWVHTDEWYVFKKLYNATKVLMTINKEVYDKPEEMKETPMAWYHNFDGGRAFYTGLGHREEDYTDTLFLKHILGAVNYVIGDNYELDYSKAKTKRVPAEEGFSKVSLATGEFSEPTEMAILPNLDILVAQRRGELLLYSQESKTVSQVGLLDVYHKTEVPNVNAEEGFMGLTIDPDFANNHFVYAFYSPKDTSVNRLSRFEFKDNKLDLGTEKIVLQFYSQRNICCHTGGSLAFGNNRTLFISTGDNSTPFDEPNQQFVSNSFAPLDDRPGHEQYDVARTAGNTNDLRGKILRIEMNTDGSYAIPQGNLFAEGTEKTKPEIFVMGNRNPYRISVDKKTNFLYWGEVGPDANKDSVGRGPRGYDEINQARQAGYFGWPFFIGDNYAYHTYNYETGESGEPKDPANPRNTSKNNTGLTELPAPQAAFIWYPYAESPDFPQVGSGGRNAMAGPVYYPELYPKETRYPEYYDGKLLIYDWIRGWVKAVTMQPNGDFDKMEPFIANIKLASPIDMEVGPDGRIYVLEYGSGWFSKNPDAGLARIDYVAPAENAVGSSKNQTTDVNAGATTMGHQQGSEVPKGESLILASDCKACHAVDKKSVGPSYTEVAKKYNGDDQATAKLVTKLINGGSGVWGEVAMPAHPSLEEDDAKEMISWILNQ